MSESDEDDDDQEQQEEPEKKQAEKPKEEKKKYAPPAPRQKTKTGDYIVTKINVKERVVEHHHEEGKVCITLITKILYRRRRVPLVNSLSIQKKKTRIKKIKHNKNPSKNSQPLLLLSHKKKVSRTHALTMVSI